MVRPLKSNMSRTGRTLARKLAAYSTAAVATAAMSDRADAEVIPYSPPGGPVVVEQASGMGVNQAFLDVDVDGQFDLRLYYTYHDPTIRGYFSATQVDNFILWSVQYLAAVVPPGETIGALSGDWEDWAELGPFRGIRGYLGIQFDIPGSSPHYGYLDVEIAGESETLTVYGGAYESLANTPIAIPVPEPGSLGMLALGAVGMTAWRRRKRHADRA